MLIKKTMSDGVFPRIIKTVNGRDASHRGAFAVGDMVEFTAYVPRMLGASAVVLRLFRDGEDYKDIPLTFVDTDKGCDRYALSLDTAALCQEESDALFFYEILFLRGWDTLFTNTQNNVTYTLSDHSEGRFLLLLYQREFDTPKWFRGRTMYHVFVDRFCRGEGDVGTREDAILNEDWEKGVPQYAEKNGDPLPNNVFFGGNLWGVAEKLEYLQSLGVGVIYLSPIFRAYSNHKYDTGDYMAVDEMFGGEAALAHLLHKAAKYDIRIILDGVFNHTGDDSKYFDRYGKYGAQGAYTNPSSPYRDWFCFRRYPEEYESWWGIEILPKLNHENEECRRYFVGEGGVAEHYVRQGIGGWRLDVADELNDPFLDELRKTVKRVSSDEAILIGEVWENAAEKTAYGKRRRYLRGDQLDSVMNYPFRNGVLAFLLGGDAQFLADVLLSVYATYPKCVSDCLMNLLGTHDTERILTVLGKGREGSDEPNAVLAHARLTKKEREIGIRKLCLAAVLQYTVYGVPSVFYGDEAGLEGHHDPFCRRPYPWGREDEQLRDHYRRLGEIRKEESVFADGDFVLLSAEQGHVVYERRDENTCITVAVNASDEPFAYKPSGKCVDLLSGKAYRGKIRPMSAVILKSEVR